MLNEEVKIRSPSYKQPLSDIFDGPKALRLLFSVRDGEPRIRNPPRKQFYGGDIIGHWF